MLKKCVNNIFFLFALLLLILGLAFYNGYNSNAKATLIEQILHREQVIARSGASSIASFFSHSGKSLSFLAEDKRIMKKDQETQKAMDEFVATWKDSPIVGVILVDEKGLVRFNANIDNQPDVGATVKDRDYFVWAKTANEKEVFFGTPIISRLGASKGKYIGIVATPLIDHGLFKGLLAAAVVLDQLAQDYLQPLKISEQTEVYILDSQGVFLNATDENLIGKNVSQYLEENPFLGSAVLKEEFKKRIREKGEGKLQVVWPEAKGNLTVLSRKLVAYSPFSLGNQLFFLAVMTPVDDALVYIGPIYLRQNVGFVLAVMAVVVILIRIAKIYALKECLKLKQAKSLQ